MTSSVSSDHELATRIQVEFIEMPGLRVSERQARRLWNLDDVTCARILAGLVEKRFLMRSRDGAYLRSSSPCQRCDAA